MDLVSFGNKRSYNEFKNNIPLIIQPLFDELRQFCIGLGLKIIEDVRMHRVVFCKSMTFRWFADFEPTSKSILIKIQKDRKIPITIFEVFPEDDLKEVQKNLKDAFDLIH